MLPGAVHIRAVNPCCDEKLLIRNNWEEATESQSPGDYLSRERRMTRPWPSTSTQMTRPFCMNLKR